MMSIRRILTVAVAMAALASTSPVLVAQNNQPDKREQERRLQQEKRDREALIKLVDAIIAGKQPAPTDVGIEWDSNHFVKASDGGTVVPFTVAVKAPSPGVAMYLRVMEKAPPAPAGGDRNKGKGKYPWEDVYFVDLKPDGRVSRLMQLSPGQYEILLAVSEKSPLQPQRNQPPGKIGFIRHDLTVPDYNGTGISISTPLIATGVEPLPVPLSEEEQRANPYTFGGTLQVSLAPGARFKVSQNFQLLFWVYGLGNTAGKPDVQIDYNFYQINADGEKYFNKTPPQVLNASTLPAQFDVTAGHQVLGLVGVPLKSFPPGRYRLEFKITDKLGGKELTDSAKFTVES